MKKSRRDGLFLLPLESCLYHWLHGSCAAAMSMPSLIPPVLPLMGPADLASRLDLGPSLSLQTCWVCGPSRQWTITISRLESYPDFLLSILHKEVPAAQEPCRGLPGDRICKGKQGV